MTFDRAKVALAFALMVLLFGLLTLLFWDFIRDVVIVPIYYFVWVVGLTLKSIPQGIYFALLLLLSLFIGLKTLDSVQVRQPFRQLERNPAQVNTQYRHWKSLCDSVHNSKFYRDRFIWEARKLVLAVLAYEQGIDSAEAETLVRNGTLVVPDAILALIERKIPAARSPLVGATGVLARLRRLFVRGDADRNLEIDRLVVEVIGFIERRLEIDHAGNELPS